MVALLKGGQAYDTFESVAKSFAKKDRGRIPVGAEHSAWQIIDHLVRALDDILEYSDNAKGKYQEKNWPADYWAKRKLGDWDATLAAYQKSRKRLEALARKGDLFTPFSWAKDHTLLREILLAADHQSYHIGELVELKRWLDNQ